MIAGSFCVQTWMKSLMVNNNFKFLMADDCMLVELPSLVSAVIYQAYMIKRHQNGCQALTGMKFMSWNKRSSPLLSVRGKEVQSNKKSITN